MTVSVTIISFGYGHAEPPRADLTLDVRDSLHNPHHDPAMRELTGLDRAVQEHVMVTPGAYSLALYLASVADVLASLGRDAVIAVGCVGGRHRSVAIAEMAAGELGDRWPIEVEHRDIGKPVLASIPQEQRT